MFRFLVRVHMVCLLGLAALAVRVSRKKNYVVETTSNPSKRSNENVNPHNR